MIHYYHAFLPPHFHLVNIVIIFFSGLVGECVGAVVGGGSLFMMPALLFTGLPLQAAIATDNASALGTEVGILSETYEKVMSNKKLLLVLTIPITVGGILGTWLLLNVSATIIKYLMIVGIIFILGHTYFSKNKPNPASISKSGYALLIVFLLIMGIYTNFIGIGQGTFGRIAVMSVLGLSFIQSQGLTSTATMPSRLYSLVVTSFAGLIVWPYLITLWCSNYLAGKYATKLVKHVPDNIMKTILTLLSIGFVIYLVFFY
ncbi:MAG TPA: sulfite exporter TauE/SafE family protein [Candidatus Saccharimonadales bacterium]